jgi:hypothetical protein
MSNKLKYNGIIAVLASLEIKSSGTAATDDKNTKSDSVSGEHKVSGDRHFLKQPRRKQPPGHLPQKCTDNISHAFKASVQLLNFSQKTGEQVLGLSPA